MSYYIAVHLRRFLRSAALIRKEDWDDFVNAQFSQIALIDTKDGQKKDIIVSRDAISRFHKTFSGAKYSYVPTKRELDKLRNIGVNIDALRDAFRSVLDLIRIFPYGPHFILLSILFRGSSPNLTVLVTGLALGVVFIEFSKKHSIDISGIQIYAIICAIASRVIVHTFNAPSALIVFLILLNVKHILKFFLFFIFILSKSIFLIVKILKKIFRR